MVDDNISLNEYIFDLIKKINAIENELKLKNGLIDSLNNAIKNLMEKNYELESIIKENTKEVTMSDIINSINSSKNIEHYIFIKG